MFYCVSLYLLLYLMVMTINGCAAGFQTPIGIERPDLKQKYLKILDDTYYDKASYMQRIDLSIANRQFSFLGYLYIEYPDTLKAKALSDIGLTIMSFTSTNSGQRMILQKPADMPKNSILHGVLPDMEHMYYITPTQCPYATVYVSNNSSTLLMRDKYHSIHEYVFSRHNNRLLLSKRYFDDKLQSIFHYNLWEYRSDVGVSIPNHITIKNNRWNYIINTKLISVKTVE